MYFVQHGTTGSVQHLKKVLKENQRSSEDNEWQLQEQLAQSNSLILKEKEHTNELNNRIAVLQNKLIEVESFLQSENGQLVLELEEELAVCKLKIAELEADKDYFEVELKKKVRNSSNIGATEVEGNLALLRNNGSNVFINSSGFTEENKENANNLVGVNPMRSL